jgi:prepilin signal peptidase PulO-like enzyme (type II secretory pathway)
MLFIDGYRVLTGRAGMGLGDAEVLLMVGALLGPAGVLFALGAGAVQGVIAAGIALALRGRIGPAHADEVADDDEEEEPAAEPAAPKDRVDSAAAMPKRKARMPFVPFLTLGALEYLLGADALVNGYLRLLHGD